MLHVVSSMRISSIRHMTPSRPCKVSDMARWNISGVERIPKGKELKQKRPNGLTKVVNNFESSLKGICQKALLASNFVNTLLSPRMTSLQGLSSRCIGLFNGVRATKIRTRPLGFGTGTMPEHHPVETVTGEMTPCRSKKSISFFTLHILNLCCCIPHHIHSYIYVGMGLWPCSVFGFHGWFPMFLWGFTKSTRVESLAVFSNEIPLLISCFFLTTHLHCHLKG